MNNENVAVNSTKKILSALQITLCWPHLSDVKCHINKFSKFYFKSLKIKIILTLFNVGDIFNAKDTIPKSLK